MGRCRNTRRRKRVWLYTDDITGYDSIKGTVIIDLDADYKNIRAVPADIWVMVGISHTKLGIEWSDIYNQDKSLKDGCAYIQIFYYDNQTDNWNTSSKVPYLSAIWVKQNLCTDVQ